MVAMAIGGGIYAYIVGSASDIISSMNVGKAQFEQTMDTLSAFVKENSIPSELRTRLREYFFHTRELRRASLYTELLELMSPTLRGEVAILANGDWIKSVSFFSPTDCSDAEHRAFVTEITMRLKIRAFAPHELIYAQGEAPLCMYIIRRGVVGTAGRVLGSGKYFGEAMILQSAVRLHDVRCLTFLDVYELNRADLDDTLQDGRFPRVYKAVRRAVAKFAFREMSCNFCEGFVPLHAALHCASSSLPQRRLPSWSFQ